MNAAELIREWPSWCRANAETVFGSAAWRLVTEYADGVAGVVRRSDITPLVTLEVTLDDAPNRLVIGESGRFGDLMRLRGRLGGLPPEVVVALVERECGALLQTVENVLARQLRIVGIAKESGDGLECFAVTVDSDEIGFAVKTDAAMIQVLGVLKNLDPGHEAIRSLKREAFAEYAEINLLESELAQLAVGDRLLLPEDAVRAWRTDAAADDLVHVRSVEPTPISFASFADDDLPEVPDSEGLALLRRGKEIGRGRFVAIGLVRAVEITSV